MNNFLYCRHCKKLKSLSLKRKVYELLISNFLCEDCKSSTFYVKENGRWRRLKMNSDKS